MTREVKAVRIGSTRTRQVKESAAVGGWCVYSGRTTRTTDEQHPRYSKHSTSRHPARRSDSTLRKSDGRQHPPASCCSSSSEHSFGPSSVVSSTCAYSLPSSASSQRCPPEAPPTPCSRPGSPSRAVPTAPLPCCHSLLLRWLAACRAAVSADPKTPPAGGAPLQPMALRMAAGRGRGLPAPIRNRRRRGVGPHRSSGACCQWNPRTLPHQRSPQAVHPIPGGSSESR